MGLCLCTNWGDDDIYAQSPLYPSDIRELAMERLSHMIQQGHRIHTIDPSTWHYHIAVRDAASPYQTVEQEVQATLAGFMLGHPLSPRHPDERAVSRGSARGHSRSEDVPPRVKRSRIVPLV